MTKRCRTPAPVFDKDEFNSTALPSYRVTPLGDMKLHTQILIAMLIGVVLGLLVGPRGVIWTPDTAVLDPARSHLVTQPESAGTPVERSNIPESASITATHGAFSEVQWVDAANTRKTAYIANDDPFLVREHSLGQTLVSATHWMGALFMNLMKMVVIPLVFCSIVVGLANIGNPRRLSTLGAGTIGAFITSTVIALGIALGLTNLIGPGRMLSESTAAGLKASGSVAISSVESRSWTEIIIGFVPSNPIASLASGDLIPIIVFGAIFGIASTLIAEPAKSRVANTFDAINETVMKIVDLVMRVAPFGVGALLFHVAGTTGFDILISLVAYCLVVLLALVVHVGFTYGLGVWLLAKRSPWTVLLALRQALLVAFSTSSSAATLPVTKRCLDDNLAVNEATSGFVLPLGATINMDGTAIYQGVAAIFIAQTYGIELGFVEQLTIIGTATTASIGTAGVPGAGMVTLVMVLTAVGIPAEGLALVLGLDRVLDMARTTVNVAGDASVTLIMDRWTAPASLSDTEPGK